MFFSWRYLPDFEIQVVKFRTRDTRVYGKKSQVFVIGGRYGFANLGNDAKEIPL